jgi:hypothetical protein
MSGFAHAAATCTCNALLTNLHNQVISQIALQVIILPVQFFLLGNGVTPSFLP